MAASTRYEAWRFISFDSVEHAAADCLLCLILMRAAGSVSACSHEILKDSISCNSVHVESFVYLMPRAILKVLHQDLSPGHTDMVDIQEKLQWALQRQEQEGADNAYK